VRRILIVNDDAFVGSTILSIFALERYEAILVRDPASAISALTTSNFDLVIVDIFLAGGDGVAFITRVRSLTLLLPIIAMTNAEFPDLSPPSLDFADLAIKAGATNCVARNSDFGQLVSTVNSVLAHSVSRHQLQHVSPLPELHSTALQGSEGNAFTKATADIVPNTLNEALTILIRHIQSLRQANDSNPQGLQSFREMIEHALSETERACRVVDYIGHTARIGGIDDLIAPSDRAIRLRPPCDRDRLTPRERQVLALLTEGMSNKSGAFRLSISVRTFETHRANIMEKFGAKNAVDLIRRSLSQAS
jgi:DNA-binding NarL/FixJ family response regulator